MSPCRRPTTRISCFFMSVLALSLDGCSVESAPAQAPAVEIGSRLEAAKPAECRLRRLLLVVDQSASTQKTLVPRVSEADVARLVAMATKCGGELATGFVPPRGNAALARLVVPLLESATSPVPRAAETGNVFQTALLVETDRLARQAKDSAAADTRAAFASALNRYVEAITPLLRRNYDGSSTPLCDVLHLGSVFFDEPAIRTEPQRIALVVGDGLETVKSTSCAAGFKADVLVVVNGSGEAGALSGAAPRKFGTLNAALAYLEALLMEEGQK